MLRATVIIALAVVASACSASHASSSGTTVDTQLTIFGAASLTGALDAVKGTYEAVLPGASLSISTDSSAALETQIEQGAPADVFLSADTANPQKLVAGGFAKSDAVVFAGNRLTIIVPAGNPAGITSPADLARPGLKIIAAGDEVPISEYAAQVVANLARKAPGFEAAYRANVVSKEDNVKAVVAKVELGEGDAGIVYLTDATASAKVDTVDIAVSANVHASYAGVVIGSSSHADAATAFLAWLAGPDGQAVMGPFGFLPPAP